MYESGPEVGSGVSRTSESALFVAEGDDVETTPLPSVTSVVVSSSMTTGGLEGVGLSVVVVGTCWLEVGETSSIRGVGKISTESVVEGLFAECVLIVGDW